MHAYASGGDSGSILAGFAIWAAFSAAYFLPVIIALARRVPNAGSVFVIDFFLAWTVVGWIIALAMACRSKPPRQPQQPYMQGPPQWQPHR